MVEAMPEPGDITDQFDDDALRRSIEGADRDGEWRDPTAKFEDPKLVRLARQLAEAPRASYAERRLRELERRAAEKTAQATKPAAAQPAPTFVESPSAATSPATPSPRDSSDTWQPSPQPAPAATATPSAPPPELDLQTAADDPLARRQWAAHARGLVGSLGSAFAVFGLGLLIQVAIAGWTPQVGGRTAIASIVAGLAWHCLRAGRFRAATIGVVIHLVAFGDTSSGATGEQLFGTFLATMVVLFASGAVGLLRETNDSSPRPHRP